LTRRNYEFYPPGVVTLISLKCILLGSCCVIFRGDFQKFYTYMEHHCICITIKSFSIERDSWLYAHMWIFRAVIARFMERVQRVFREALTVYIHSRTTPPLVTLSNRIERLFTRVWSYIPYHHKRGTDQWDWRVVYEIYTLAFWHLHNTWPHTHNTARKIHTLHKPSDHCTENSHVGVKPTVTLYGKWFCLHV
jgi:hypothetical protein